jgi:alpha-1,2-mannosyltransferase
MSSKFRYKQGLLKARTPQPQPLYHTQSASNTSAQKDTKSSGSGDDSSEPAEPPRNTNTKPSSDQSAITSKSNSRSNRNAKAQSNKSGKPQPYVARRPADEVRELLDDVSYDADHSKLKKRSQKSTSGSSRVVIEETRSSCWSPAPYAAFKLLVSSRFAAALWTTISDCDETYNYWEPAHYLLYGKGFQTWEYSPEYALRSYTYILIHAVPAKLYDFFLSPNPLLIFFFIRCLLAFVSALTELFLYRAVRRYFGGNIARIALVTSLFAPGMFISSSAFLPSAFSSYMTALAIGAWLEELYELSILAVAVSALLSWPFAALTGALIAFDIVVLQRKIRLFLTWSVISLVIVLVPIVAIDSSHYGKLVIAPLNIVKYNIFSSKGPDLYGTEPWSYYMINGVLNFNLIFILAIMSPLFLCICWRLVGRGTVAVYEKMVVLGTTLIWLFVFVMQPHKEERFLFPIFPLIPVCGAIGLDSILNAIESTYRKILQLSLKSIQPILKSLRKCDTSQTKNIVTLAIVVAASVIGCSRMVALHYGYRAPFDIYFNLHREAAFAKLEAEDSSREFVLCYGKEWYRFPTSFFLPNQKWSVRFIQSEFKGQLPNLYPRGDPDGTKRIPEHMNDMNAEEPTRYVPVADCDFLVDTFSLDGSGVSSLEPNYAASKDWAIISEQEFLNSKKSSPFFRAFYIPFISTEYTVYDRYVLLKSQITKPKTKKRKSATSRASKTPPRAESTDDFDLDDDF